MPTTLAIQPRWRQRAGGQSSRGPAPLSTRQARSRLQLGQSVRPGIRGVQADGTPRGACDGLRHGPSPAFERVGDGGEQQRRPDHHLPGDELRQARARRHREALLPQDRPAILPRLHPMHGDAALGHRIEQLPEGGFSPAIGRQQCGMNIERAQSGNGQRIPVQQPAHSRDDHQVGRQFAQQPVQRAIVAMQAPRGTRRPHAARRFAAATEKDAARSASPGWAGGSSRAPRRPGVPRQAGAGDTPRIAR